MLYKNFFYLPTTLLSFNCIFLTSSKSTFPNELNRDQNESLMIKQIDEPHHLHANNPLETIFAPVSQKIYRNETDSMLPVGTHVTRNRHGASVAQNFHLKHIVLPNNNPSKNDSLFVYPHYIWNNDLIFQTRCYFLLHNQFSKNS
jgi:hypothetical protein